MAIFPDDDNGDVLRRMEQHGVDFTKPHTIDFFFAFPSEAAALRSAQSIEDQGGYEVTVGYRPDDEQYGLQASRRMMLDHAAITLAEAALIALTSQHGGEPEGWGVMQE